MGGPQSLEFAPRGCGKRTRIWASGMLQPLGSSPNSPKNPESDPNLGVPRRFCGHPAPPPHIPRQGLQEFNGNEQPPNPQPPQEDGIESIHGFDSRNYLPLKRNQLTSPGFVWGLFLPKDVTKAPGSPPSGLLEQEKTPGTEFQSDLVGNGP